jgi:uncharacterized protein YdaU (DUF1376 family)
MVGGTMSPPLTAPDCDCTDLDGFMLNVERLMASELVALSSHEVVAAALFVWCRAWKQKPAASLPDDDRVIAAFCRLSTARFRRLKPEIMRGFIKCSDGRLYHKTLAEEAMRAFAKKVTFQKKRASDSERLRSWRERRSETHSETPHETSDETRFVAEGQGQGQGQKKEDDQRARKDVDARSFHKVCALLGYNSSDARNWDIFIRMQTTDNLVFSKHILPTAERLARSENHGNSMAYLRKAALDEPKRAANGHTPQRPEPEYEDPSDWRVAVANFLGPKRLWARTKWGPAPGEPGCRAPLEILSAASNQGAHQ